MHPCWFLANNLECVHRTCNFSHNHNDIKWFQTHKMIDEWCEYGGRCPYKCDKKHRYIADNINSNGISNGIGNGNGRKRQREDVVDDCLETQVRELKRQLSEKDNIITELKYDIDTEVTETRELKRQLSEKDYTISELKNDVETDKRVVMLSYKVSRKNQEMEAVKEHHREVLRKEYLDSNYSFVKNVNRKFYESFKRFRIDFYNNRDNSKDKLIDTVEKYITDVNNNNGYQSLRMF